MVLNNDFRQRERLLSKDFLWLHLWFSNIFCRDVT